LGIFFFGNWFITFWTLILIVACFFKLIFKHIYMSHLILDPLWNANQWHDINKKIEKKYQDLDQGFSFGSILSSRWTCYDVQEERDKSCQRTGRKVEFFPGICSGDLHELSVYLWRLLTLFPRNMANFKN
jgi:hypothetical protein